MMNYVILPMNYTTACYGLEMWDMQKRHLQRFVALLEAMPEAALIAHHTHGYDTYWDIYFEDLDIATMHRKVAEALQQAGAHV